MESFLRRAAPMSHAPRVRRPLAAAAWAAFFLCLALTSVSFAVYDRLARPIGFDSRVLSTSETLDVSRGSSASAVAQELRERGFNVDVRLFGLASRWIGLDRRIYAGEYRVCGSMSMLDLLRLFGRGEVVEHRVTIPEGFTAKKVAARLAEEGLVDEMRFLAVVDKPALAFPDGLPAALAGVGNLEGYLFPDTYLFDGSASAKSIVRTMVTRFLDVAMPLYRQSPLAKSHSLRELVTLASIVEGEAALDRERPLIAGVFLNRLERRMPLESCATVEYALGVHKEVLSLKDLAVDSPYNTYRNYGLPPTPIGNPGRRSLAAAMYPARRVAYLFFVARGDGSHVFSRTFAEHLRAQALVERPARERGR